MMQWYRIVAGAACLWMPLARASGQGASAYKLIGVEACAECHKSEKSGDQITTWKKSKHAEAYTTLTTAKADEMAKAKGLSTVAKDSPECLECHTVQGAKPDELKNGVACESCHGPGSAYQKLAVMKDKERSIAAGMTKYEDKAAIERQCRTCHNEKSPSFKEFDFEKRWEQIKHTKPPT